MCSYSSSPLVDAVETVWPGGSPALPGSADILCGAEPTSAHDSGSEPAVLPAACEGRPPPCTLHPVLSAVPPEEVSVFPCPPAECQGQWRWTWPAAVPPLPGWKSKVGVEL